MQKTKGSSQTGSSSVRPVTISSQFRYEKVEQLNQIVTQLGHKRETVPTETQFGTTLGDRGAVVGQQVLQVLKKKIKNNYEQLYSNYADNKTKILKQIQTVETNISGENAMNSKFQEVVKEKGRYDKLKASVEDKQRRLKKLRDLRDQLTQQNLNDSAQTTSRMTKQQLQHLQEKKQQGEHTLAIYTQMLKQRKQIKLILDKRQKQMAAELSSKQQKQNKLATSIRLKRQTAAKLEENLSKEEVLQIPAGLAQELTHKIEQYQNKHSYTNILHYESALEQQRFEQKKQEVSARKQMQLVQKTRKEKQERRQLQLLQHQNALNSMQQHAIKRICGTQSLEQAINNPLGTSQNNLQHISKHIEQQIELIQQQNHQLEQQIEGIMSQDQESKQNESIEELIKIIELEQTKRKIEKAQLEKKKALANHWQTILHLINNNQHNKEALQEFTTKALNRQICETQPQTTRHTQRNISLSQEDSSQQLE